MRRAFFPACAAIFAILLAMPAFTAEVAAPDMITLDNYRSDTGNLVVEFNHSTHAEYDCTECHHNWDPGCGELPKPCSYSGCHDVMDKRDKSESSYFKIIHDMRPKTTSTCVSCHRESAGDSTEKRKELAGCRGSVCHP